MEHVLAAHIGPIFICDHAIGDGFCSNLVIIQPAAIIRDHNRNPVAGLARGNPQMAKLFLPSGVAFVRRLDTVTNRIAHNMRHRIADHLDHFAVKLYISALDLQRHLLAKVSGKIANQSGEDIEQGFNPLHAHAGNCIAHIVENCGEPFERAVNCWLCSG